MAYFHGGGWARGSRQDRAEERLLALAAHGVAVASVSYRLIDTATHPAQLEDGRAALGWLRTHGVEHGLATDRIGAWGASAGGWIALMLALSDQGDGTGLAKRPDAVCAWFAPTDLTTVRSQRDGAALALPEFIRGRAIPDMEAGLLGLSNIGDDPMLARAASPVTHAQHARTPVLLIHGDRDGLISCAQSRALHGALTRAGGDSQLLLLAGANHEDEAFHKPAVLAATAGFFSAALSG